MAATATAQKAVSIGDTENVYFGTISLDASYPTGGEAIDLANCERIEFLIAQNTGGYNFRFDATTQKLLAFRTDQVDDPEEQVPDTTDLSAVTGIPFLAIGS